MAVLAPPIDDRSARLVWGEDGAPRSGRFNDVYFSTEDGLAESRAVFLHGCGLPQAWAGRSSFTVVELGFGTGLNIVALLDLWSRHRPESGGLNIVSVEAFPITREEAERALSAWPEVAAVAAPLLAAWPSGTPGFHRVDLPDFGATLDLLVGDAADVLGRWSGRADGWFLDGFSPATNPGMWSGPVLDAVAARSVPGAKVATFTVAGAVRRGLAERGFVVDKRPGHGRKRERLEAVMPGAASVASQTPRVAVIGGGIAGASLCRALSAVGAVPVLVERDAIGAGASGFPAALLTPRLDAGDAVIAGLHAQALERASDLYRRVPDAVTAETVLQLAQAPRDPARFAKVAAQPIWRSGALSVLAASEASDHLGETVDTPALMMTDALSVRPAAILDAWLAGVERVEGEVEGLRPTASGWDLIGADGRTLLSVDAVVIASGWGTAALMPDLPLAPVRGQADWIEGTVPPAAAWGGYVAPTADGFLFGATHDRGEVATDVRAADTRRNRDTLAARLPDLAARTAGASTRSRAAVRATTPDRLPICGQAPGKPGLWVLSGMGSRGFCLAPLLAEHVAACIVGGPSPLPTDFAERLSPARFDPRLPERATG